MKYLTLLLFIAMNAYAKPLLILSAFDPFGKSSFNNSERIGREVTKQINQNQNLPYEVKFCYLETVYDEGYAKLSECVREEQGRELIGVISLGEGFCSLDIETYATNYNDNEKEYQSPDNKGQRKKGAIVEGAPYKLGFTLPLDRLYCSLSKDEKKLTLVSNNTGHFVCNNTAYLFKYNYPDIPYSFIHVPSNKCSMLESKTKTSINILKKYIDLSYNAYTNKESFSYPTEKDEAEALLGSRSSCQDGFLKDFINLF